MRKICSLAEEESGRMRRIRCQKYFGRGVSGSPAASTISSSWRQRLFSSWQNGVVTSLGACCGVGSLLFFLWKPFREDSVHQTAVVASEALADFKIKVQAVALSKEVVEQVLRDPKSVELLVLVVGRLLQQPDTKKAVTSFLSSIFEDHYTKEVTKKFVIEILDSKEVRDHLDVVLYDLVIMLLKNPKVKDALVFYLLESASEALRDQSFHYQAGGALRSSLYFAVNPLASAPKPES